MAEQDKLTLEVQLKTQIDRKFGVINRSLKQILRSTTTLQKNLLTVDDYLVKHLRNVNKLSNAYAKLQRRLYGPMSGVSTYRSGGTSAGGAAGGGIAGSIVEAGIIRSGLGVKRKQRSMIPRITLDRVKPRYKNLRMPTVGRSTSEIGVQEHQTIRDELVRRRREGQSIKDLADYLTGPERAYKLTGRNTPKSIYSSDKRQMVQNYLLADRSYQNELAQKQNDLIAQKEKRLNRARFLRNRKRQLSNLKPLGLLNSLGVPSHMIGALSIGAGVTGSLKAFMEDETSTISLNTIFGKMGVGIKGQMDTMAAKTPMSRKDLYKGAITLGSYGVPLQNIQEMLRRLGDVAGGDPYKLQSLVTAYGRTFGMNKLQGAEKNMILDNSGANVLAVIGKRTGKSMAEMSESMRKGEVTAAQVTQAFKDMTNEGGKFFNMMEKQSQTVKGKLSTLSDEFNNLGIVIGDMLKGPLGTLMRLAGKGLKSLAASHPETFAERKLNILKNLNQEGGYKGLTESQIRYKYARKHAVDWWDNLNEGSLTSFLPDIEKAAGRIFDPKKVKTWGAKTLIERYIHDRKFGVDWMKETDKIRALMENESLYSAADQFNKSVKTDNKSSAVADAIVQTGTGIQAGGRRVQQVNIEVEQMIGQLVENQTGVTKEKLQNALVELIPEMKKVLGTLQTSV